MDRCTNIWMDGQTDESMDEWRLMVLVNTHEIDIKTCFSYQVCIAVATSGIVSCYYFAMHSSEYLDSMAACIIFFNLYDFLPSLVPFPLFRWESDLSLTYHSVPSNGQNMSIRRNSNKLFFKILYNRFLAD